ncbi:hypothetical protein [Prescottella agglutinans]|nr:hypothetical protein [Prescottella agglutinans]
MSTEEQIAFVKGLRQQIEDDPSISEREKYRISHDQPGLITRLDDEIKRLETGQYTDRSGQNHDLTDQQRNSGAQLQAIQYLGTMVPRIQTAKNTYFELNARHTGRSIEQVQAEWNSIMARKGEGRGGVGISLRDNWRDDLAVAGMSAQAQADLGQSKRARDALREMEERRVAHLAQQPARPTIRPEHRRVYARSGADGNVRCAQCGQFGHEQPACPNGDLVEKRRAIEEEYHAATNALKAASTQQVLDSGQELVYLKKEDGTEVGGEEARRLLERDRDMFAQGNPITTVDEANAKLKAIANRDAEIQDEMSKRSGGSSNWIQEVAYNDESGLMMVTTQPRQNKDGSISPSKTYPYRVSKAEAAQILASPEIGGAISRTVMRRGHGETNDEYHWENDADASAAQVQQKCPTCGRWASMTSSHRCPVPGSDAVDEGMNDRAAQAMWRAEARTARAAGLEPPAKPMARTNLVRQRQYPLPGTGGIANVPPAQDVRAVVEDGKIASPSLSFRYPDATVTGQATIWRDESGIDVASPFKEAGGNGMRCTCSTYARTGRCDHIASSLQTMASAYGVTYTGDTGLRPGVSLANRRRERTSDTAFDAPKAPLERMNYSRLQKLRNQRQGDHVQGLFEKVRRGDPINTPSVKPPRDAEGRRVAWPTTFERAGKGGANSDRTTDLNDTADVQYRLRAALFARTRTHYSVLRDRDGGMRITVPKARRGKDGTIPPVERQRLVDTLGIQAHQSRADGVYIPADTSWRHEMLSRAYGDNPPPIRAARYTVA